MNIFEKNLPNHVIDPVVAPAGSDTFKAGDGNVYRRISTNDNYKNSSAALTAQRERETALPTRLPLLCVLCTSLLTLLLLISNNSIDPELVSLSQQPTLAPTSNGTTYSPTAAYTLWPTPQPTVSPTPPTASPTASPTAYPTAYPTAFPTASPIYINTPGWRDQSDDDPAWGTTCLWSTPFANPDFGTTHYSSCTCADYADQTWCSAGSCCTAIGGGCSAVAKHCMQFGANTHCSACGGRPRVFHNIHEGNAEFDRLWLPGDFTNTSTNLLENSCKVTIPPQGDVVRNPNKFSACFSPFNYDLASGNPGNEYRNAHSVPSHNPQVHARHCPNTPQTTGCAGNAKRFTATCEVEVTDVLTTMPQDGGKWYAYLVDEDTRPGVFNKCNEAQCGEIDYVNAFRGVAANVLPANDLRRIKYAHAWDHNVAGNGVPVGTGGQRECIGWGPSAGGPYAGDYLTHSGTDDRLLADGGNLGMRYCSITLELQQPSNVPFPNVRSTTTRMGSSRPPHRWEVEVGDVFRWFQNSNNKDNLGINGQQYYPLVGFKICI